jgi:hypothetical protein
MHNGLAMCELAPHLGTMVKIPKIHLNYFQILQTLHSYTKSGTLSSKLTFFELNKAAINYGAFTLDIK